MFSEGPLKFLCLNRGPMKPNEAETVSSQSETQISFTYDLFEVLSFSSTSVFIG